MTVELSLRLRCEMCGRKSSEDKDEAVLARRVHAAGWRTLRWDCYGNTSDVCPACAGNLTDEAIGDALLAKAERESPT